MTEVEYFKGDELAASTWRNKYANPEDKTPDDMHRRLAKAFYEKEKKYDDNELAEPRSEYGRKRTPLTENAIFELFKDFKYVIPGGSVMSGIDSESPVSLSNCFVIGGPEDSYSSIMKTRSFQAQLMKRRGGVGKDLSKLRPRGALVNNSAKSSTGAASFMNVDSEITNEVAQNGRRGALMLTMSINHPDILEFITKKQDLTKVTGANISVKVTDEFMTAVQYNRDYILRFPVNTKIPEHLSIDEMPYDELWFYEDDDYHNCYFKKIKAKELWNTLIHCAHSTAEPGIMFESRMHDYAPDGTYPEFRMVSTNPCGEIGMGPFDSCRLIHLNLTSFVDSPFTELAYIDYDKLYKVAYEAMRLADDLVDLELDAVQRILDKVKDNEDKEEFDLWSKIKETAQLGRRTGLGFTGLADMIAMLNVKFAGESSREIVYRVMYTIMEAQLHCQIDMALQRGVFPAWNSDNEFAPSLSCGVTLTGKNDWYDYFVREFESESEQMFHYGRRNISWSTVAPTGTVSLMAQCSSGIEPVFQPFYQRRRKCMSPDDRVDYIDKVGEKYTLFTVVHPGLMKWANLNNTWNKNPVSDWDIKDWEDAFKRSPYYGSTSQEINWSDRVALQSIIQEYITHSISSTVNLSQEVSEKEVSDLYIKAWLDNLKGITIYRQGSREGILVDIKQEASMEGREAPKRPKKLEADVHTVKINGEQFVVLIGLFEGRPYEVFAFKPNNPLAFPMHKGVITKIGKMHYSFKSEFLEVGNLKSVNEGIEESAATLYTSMLLRHGVSIKHIIKVAKKVNENIVSFSSAMCRVLAKYDKKEVLEGEKCPECGSSLVREGGCIHCSSCSWSKCS